MGAAISVVHIQCVQQRRVFQLGILKTRPQPFKLTVKRFFQANDHSCAIGGLLLEFEDFHIHLWAVVGGILRDGDAHNFVWRTRGDGASTYGVFRGSVFTKSSSLVDEDRTNLLRCSIISLDEFVLMTVSALCKNARYLASQIGLDV